MRRILREARPVDPFTLRVTASGEENRRGDFILYWMQTTRRIEQNLALEYAIAKANAANLPVVVYESLRESGYESQPLHDRIHSFIREGAEANAVDAERHGLRYVSFVPRTPEETLRVVAEAAKEARLVVTDDYPTLAVRELTERFVAGSRVAVHLVDGNGILPMRAFAKEQYSAKFLRDRAHRLFPEYWRFTHAAQRPLVAQLDVTGYSTNRHVVSGLSPYLHFGRIGVHEVAEHVLFSDAPQEDIDAFLEQLIIRRELSFNFCFYNRAHTSLDCLPDWAKKTLDKHRGDRRKPSYSYEELERGETYDHVWNLAHRQLLDSGTMHGYLRMLWGKKIIEWSDTPEEACATMIHLHDRYALDGRDPNTYAGVMWCFGKHDRPWAPERPIFGSIRWMSSAQTAKKMKLRDER
jgi:deoxyribodipyrimidine photo-lyase